MNFIVEDGTGKTTSTSYVTVAFADTYADTFFSFADYTTWDELAETAKQRYLNQATLYIDNTYVFSGDRATSEQALQFPRENLYDSDGELVEDEVPIAIQNAVVLAVKRLINGTELSEDFDRGTIIREKIDTIDITYQGGASRATSFTEIDNLLKASGFIISNRNSSSSIRLVLH